MDIILIYLRPDGMVKLVERLSLDLVDYQIQIHGFDAYSSPRDDVKTDTFSFLASHLAIFQ